MKAGIPPAVTTTTVPRAKTTTLAVKVASDPNRWAIRAATGRATAPASTDALRATP